MEERGRYHCFFVSDGGRIYPLLGLDIHCISKGANIF